MEQVQEKEIESSVWKGSSYTAGTTAKEIEKRWGIEESKKYQPAQNCFTYKGWRERGYQVKKGEKGIKSITFIKGTKKDKKTGKIEDASYPKNVTLFYYLQVEKIKL